MSVESKRRWRQANPHKRGEERRRYYKKYPEKELARRQALKDQRQAILAALRSEFWDAQGGCCYLCGDEISAEPHSAVVDHDHRCCPYKKSCRYCRRGLACDRCNLLIGLVGDSPELLRQIADSLALKLAEVDERLMSKPIQGALELTP